MEADIIPLIVGSLVFFSSLIFLKLGLSVAIIEILLGTAAGNLGLRTEDWMTCMASFGGMKISFPLISTALGLFIILFLLKISAKFKGVYFLAKKFIPQGRMYTTLLMSTGLTFGTIASVFGFNSGLINQVQYSVLVGVVIASAVIPTFIAQKWFRPVHSEDIVENDAMNGRNGKGK